jgi:UPF0271 protein
MDYAPGELTDEVLYQLAALDGLARVAGGRVTYLKPHGALYHRCGRDERQAGAVVAAVRAYDPGLAVLGAPGSALLRLAGEAGLRVVPEAFADRAYTAAGTLVPRTEPGAVLTDPDRVIAQAVRLVTEGAVDAVTGEPVEVRAESLCLHGDTPGAVDLARRVRAALGAAGVEVAPFVAA